jgi:hypothetical protein
MERNILTPFEVIIKDLEKAHFHVRESAAKLECLKHKKAREANTVSRKLGCLLAHMKDNHGKTNQS